MDLHQFADAIDKELDRLTEERDHWLGAKLHVENLMRLRAEPVSKLVTQLQPAAVRQEPPVPVRRRRSRLSENGQLPMRRAVLQVLQGARGSAMRVEDILAQAQALGATTGAKNPVNVLDLQLYGLRDRDNLPVEKVGKRTWRWAGPLDDELHGGDASRQEELIKQEARP
jgi:hypothetical protein